MIIFNDTSKIILNVNFYNFYFQRYSKGFIFPIEELKKAGMPIEPKSLQDFLEKSCEQFRHKLVKEYEI